MTSNWITGVVLLVLFVIAYTINRQRESNSESIGESFGNGLSKLSLVGYVVFGGAGIVYTIKVLWEAWGVLGLLFGVPLLPMAYFFTPWHSLMEWGEATHMAVAIGGPLLALGVGYVGGKLEGV